MSGDVEMSFLEHLEELRSRILYCLYSLVPAVCISFYFADPIVRLITQHARTIPQFSQINLPFKIGFSPVTGPVFIYEQPVSESILVGLSPTEPVVVYMKVALVASLFFVLPFIMYQVWKFIEPGLKSTEKKFLIPFVVSSWFSFILGALFAYTVMLEIAVPFLAGFGEGVARNTWSLNSYVSFTLTMVLVFGIVFELPVVMGLLSMLGVVTPEFLVKYRRYSILLIFIVAAILTPPDPVTQTLLAVPLMLLYEVSIWVARFTRRKPTALVPV
jgi:sec-independent protein translocase protein TatC